MPTARRRLGSRHQRLPPRRALFRAVRGLGAGAARLHLFLDRRFHRAPDRGDDRRRDPRPAEQYQQRGLAGPGRDHPRAQRRPSRADDMLYLLTDPLLHPLAGNLSRLAAGAADPRRLDRLSRSRSRRDGGRRDPQRAAPRSSCCPAAIACWSGAICATPPPSATRITRHAGLVGAADRLALGIAGGVFMTRNMLRRVEAVNRTSEQHHPRRPRPARAAVRQRRRVRPARRPTSTPCSTRSSG